MSDLSVKQQASTATDDAIGPVLAGAADAARAAILSAAEDRSVGEYLGVSAEDSDDEGRVIAATHRFAALVDGYVGWQWAVVVAAPADATAATVSEVVLLPGPDSVIAPAWVPWEDRVRPGDLGPGDVLAPKADDERLVPAYLDSGRDDGADEASTVAAAIGLGRTQVMSRVGRELAAARWFDGYGPETDMARSTSKSCYSCGFFLPLAGSLRAAFGVCGNELAADGHVVHAGYGCGAHSDTALPTGAGSPAFDPYDDGALEVVRANA